MSTRISLLLLIIALIAGIGGAFGVQQYIKSQTQGLELLVAARDIEAGQVVQSEMLTREVVPVRFEEFAKHAVKLSDAHAVVGRAATSPIGAGQVVLFSHFDPVKPKRDLFARLGPDDRAISIGVGLETSVANVIQPGDYVDVLAAFDATRFQQSSAGHTVDGETPSPNTSRIADTLSALRQGGGGGPAFAGAADGLQVRTILKRVTVLGVGQRFNDPRYAIDNPNYSYNVVTLKVSQVEAELIMFAQTIGGRLTLTLRHPQSPETEGTTRPVDFDAFVDLTE